MTPEGNDMIDDAVSKGLIEFHSQDAVNRQIPELFHFYQVRDMRGLAINAFHWAMDYTTLPVPPLTATEPIGKANVVRHTGQWN